MSNQVTYLSDCCNAPSKGSLTYDPSKRWFGKTPKRTGRCSKCHSAATFHQSVATMSEPVKDEAGIADALWEEINARHLSIIDDAPVLEPSAKEAFRNAFVSLREQNWERDKDWVLAMAAALDTDSGFDIPIIPHPKPFQKLFEAIRSAAQQEKVP